MATAEKKRTTTVKLSAGTVVLEEAFRNSSTIGDVTGVGAIHDKKSLSAGAHQCRPRAAAVAAESVRPWYRGDSYGIEVETSKRANCVELAAFIADR